MPYSLKNPPKDLVKKIKKRHPKAGKNEIRMFIHVFNSSQKKGDSEATSFAKAWGQLNQSKKLKSSHRKTNKSETKKKIKKQDKKSKKSLDQNIINKIIKLSYLLKEKGFFEEYKIINKFANDEEDSNGMSLTEKAINHFGTTYNFDEAGYIFPDGQLLDLSGKNKGGSGGYRAYDHRNISIIMDDLKDSPSENMRDFMIETGAIRFSKHDDYALFDMEKWPSREQLNIIKDFATLYNMEAIGISLPGENTSKIIEPSSWREISKLIA